MEIRQVILARALQIVGILGTVGYLPDLVPKIKERYGFVIAPDIVDLITPSVPPAAPKGAEYKHGKAMFPGRSVVIQQLTVFNDGVVVDTATSTEDSDLILNDLAVWASSEIPQATPIGPRYYLSQIEVKAKGSFAQYRATFHPVGEALRTILKGYGIDTPQFEVSAVNLHFDQLGKAPPQPGVFYIDRSKAVPYSDNVWLSQAPLKTNDHLQLLKDLDR